VLKFQKLPTRRARKVARRGSAAGFPLLRPEDVAEAVLVAARDEQSGQAWVCQPGREAVRVDA